jgi:hypothetical protein
MDQELRASTFCRNVAISIAATACVQAAQKSTFQAAMGLFSQLLYIQRVHQSVNGDENISLLAMGVDALAYRYDANASKLETFEQLHGVGEIAGDSAGVVYQNYVELATSAS